MSAPFPRSENPGYAYARLCTWRTWLSVFSAGESKQDVQLSQRDRAV